MMESRPQAIWRGPWPQGMLEKSPDRNLRILAEGLPSCPLWPAQAQGPGHMPVSTWWGPRPGRWRLPKRRGCHGPLARGLALSRVMGQPVLAAEQEEQAGLDSRGRQGWDVSDACVTARSPPTTWGLSAGPVRLPEGWSPETLRFCRGGLKPRWRRG